MRFYSVKRLELVSVTNGTTSTAPKSIISISVERRLTENDVVFVILYDNSTLSVFTACDVNSDSSISPSSVDWNALLKKEGKFGASCQSKIIKHALQPELCRFLAVANDLGEIFVVPLRYFGLDTTESSDKPDAIRKFHCNLCDDVLRTPSELIWHRLMLSDPRDLIFCGNKRGDIYVADVQFGQITVTISAPQSIARLQMVRDDVGVDMLVTGFAGTQWFVPVERPDQIYRDTLSTTMDHDLVEKVPLQGTIVPCKSLSCIFGVYFAEQQIFKLLPSRRNFDELLFNIELPPETHSCEFADTVIYGISSNGICVLVIDSVLKTEVHFRQTISNQEFGGSPAVALTVLPLSNGASALPSVIVATADSVFFCVEDKSLIKNSLAELAIEKDFRHVDALMSTLKIPPDDVYRSAGEMAIARQKPDVALELLEKSKTNLKEIAKIFFAADQIAAILPWLHSRLKKDSAESTMEFADKIDLANLMVEWFIGCEKPALGSLFRKFLWHNTNYEPEAAFRRLFEAKLYSCAAIVVKVHLLYELLYEEILTIRWPTDDYSFYDVLFLPGTMRHFVKHPDVGQRFLLRISNAINEFPASVFYQCLEMLDPWNLAVASILRDAKQGLKTDEPPLAIYSLLTIVADLYLRSLFWFLFAAPGNYREWEAERLKDRRNSLRIGNCLALGVNLGLVVGSDGIYGWGRSNLDVDNDQLPYRIELPLKISVVSIGCGTTHSICLTDRGELLGWGSNRYGQVGVGKAMADVKAPCRIKMPEAGTAIACGQYHTLVLGAGGRAYAFGWSLHGQTGQKSIIDDVFEPTVVQGVDKVTQVAAGFVHSVFLRSDGSIFLCGNGSYGQIGIGEIRKVKLPIKLESLKAVRLIASGWFHTLALTVDKRLYVWGASPQSLKFKAFMKRKKQQQSQQDEQPAAAGQPMVEKFSEGSMTFADEVHLRPTEVEIQHVQGEIVALRAGMHHNILLTQMGEIYCWGRGMEYQLGFGDKRERTKPTLAVELSERNPIEIACGSEHSMAVDELGLLWGWGRNDCAQLGFHSLDESERNKLSGKRLMIQRGSKPQRTITLPMDSRIFVAKPTRLSGMKAIVGKSNLRCFDEANLVAGFRSFSGFYDVDDMIFLCEKYKKPKLKSLLLLLKGRSEEAMELLGDSLSAAELDDKEFCAALFSLMKEFAGNDPVEKMKILKPILRRFAKVPENAELQLAAEKEFWYSVVAELLAVEPESVPLSGEFKLNLLTQVSKSRESQRTFVELNRFATSKTADEGDASVVFCSCKHVIRKDRIAGLLAERQIFAGRILPPESRDVLRRCYDRGQIGLCPNCLLMDSAILNSLDESGATGSDSSDILL